MIYEFEGFVPVIHESAFVHPQAAVTGNVVIGRDVYVGPGAAVRGDWGAVIVGDGCNVQESCTIHAFPGATAVLEDAAHMGHGSVLHGGRLGENVLVGMNAVIMDHAEVGAGCIVGALTFIPGEMKIPPRKVVVGSPARIVRDVTDEMLAWKSDGTRHYQELPARMRAGWRPCEPLREIPADRRGQQQTYQTWKQARNRG